MTEQQAAELLAIMANVEFLLHVCAFVLTLLLGSELAKCFLNAIRNRTEL